MRRLQMTSPSLSVLTLVYERDFGRCAKCGLLVGGRRGFDFSVHHRRPRGAGGSKNLGWVNLSGNLILLHGSGVIESGKLSCHGEIESNRTDSYHDGFLVSMNGIRKSCEVPILHAVHGPCLLTDDGDFISQKVLF
jgi:5-methylcytosine-specific restriction protein A